MNSNNDAIRHTFRQDKSTDVDVQSILLFIVIYVAKIELYNIYILLAEFKKSTISNLVIWDIGKENDK